MNYKVKDEDRIKRTGRKPVGYSITKYKWYYKSVRVKDLVSRNQEYYIDRI